jgi:hypothetical protein
MKLVIFLPIFNISCMRPNIQYDGKSCKIFGSLKQLKTACLRETQSSARCLSRCSVLAIDLFLHYCLQERGRERGRVSLVGVTPLWMGKGSGLSIARCAAFRSSCPASQLSIDRRRPVVQAAISVGSAVPHPYQRVNHGSYQAMQHAYI